jgi:hypothetical protein
LGIISRGRRCESWVCGCWEASGCGVTGKISAVFGSNGVFLGAGTVFLGADTVFLGAVAFFTGGFFASLGLLAVFLAVFGADFWGVEVFLSVFVVFFAVAFFFGWLFGELFGAACRTDLVVFFMVSPLLLLFYGSDYNIKLHGWL